MLKLFSEGKRSYLNSQKRLIVPNGLFESVHIHDASRTCKFAQKMFFTIDVLMLQEKKIMIFLKCRTNLVNFHGNLHAHGR